MTILLTKDLIAVAIIVLVIAIAAMNARGAGRSPGAILQVQKGMAQCCTLKEIVREITPT